MQDTITKEITVKATREQAYKAVTDPEQITAWFPDAVEDGKLAVGERPFFRFGDFKTRIYVESAKPFEYFAYRWVPGGVAMLGDVLTVANTLVEFFIEELPEGTKVTLKESGFTSLPEENAQASFEIMQEGWDTMMERLKTTLNQA